MSREEYKNWLSELTDNQLFKIAKQNIISNQLNSKSRTWRDDYIYNECNNRNEKILDVATNDAFIELASIDKIKYGCNTKRINRIDYMLNSEINHNIETIKTDNKKETKDDFILGFMSINDLLELNNKNLTLIKVKGDSMIEANINNEDYLIIEKTDKLIDGKLFVINYYGNTYVKRIKIEQNDIWLISENKDFISKKISDRRYFEPIGMVIASFRKH